MSTTITSRRVKEITSRRQGIANCIEWLSTLSITDSSESNFHHQSISTNTTTKLTTTTTLETNVQFAADSSSDEDGIGVFCKRSFSKGELIFQLPMKASLTINHEIFQSSPQLQAFLKDSQETLQYVIDINNKHVSPHDRYSKVQGRVILKNYFLLAFVLTLMLLDKDNTENSNIVETIKKKLDMSHATQFWSTFLDTQPHNWSHVPLLWTEEDLKPIQGTSFYALTVRFQTELKQVFESVFLPMYTKHVVVFNDEKAVAAATTTNSTTPLPISVHSSQAQRLFQFFQKAMAIVNSHSHSIEKDNDTAIRNVATAHGLINFKNLLKEENYDDRPGYDNASSSGAAFVEPIPIIFPIVDLINGTRRTKDSTGELSMTKTTYQVRATKELQVGDEVLLCYGEDTLNNVDFFVKFGYIPLLDNNNNNNDHCPVLVPNDFVTLPLGPPPFRPSVVEDDDDGGGGGVKTIPKLDQLRWTELEKHGMGKDRLVEPIPYFQRLFYLNGDVEAVRRLRTSSAFTKQDCDDLRLPQIDKLEHYVLTMLANKHTLKKLSEGKIPPPPMLEPWEPGQKIIQILDYYLNKYTTLSQSTTEQDLESCKHQTGNRLLATHARIVERELLLLWRHAIASHHQLYSAERAKVERLPRSNKRCCVQCRTSLHLQPCPKCQSVNYCSETCRTLDWNQGQHNRICPLFAAKKVNK